MNSKKKKNLEQYSEYFKKMWKNQKNSDLKRFLQLTFFYILSLLQLYIGKFYASGTFITLFNFGIFENFDFSTPFQLELFRFLNNPGLMFLLYYCINEFIIARPYIFKFSVVVRYHFSYIMLLELIYMNIIGWMELLHTAQEDLFDIPRAFINPEMYTLVFNTFFILYLYSYILGIFGKIPRFPYPFNILNKCIDFWMKIAHTR